MSKLWEPNPDYDPSKPQWLDNMPYVRLYKNLTPKKLAGLLNDAKRLSWQVLDLRFCGLVILPDMLGELEDLRVLALGNIFDSITGDFNTFRQLPDSVMCLTNLQSLDLSFTSIDVLPDSIENLTNLQSLSLWKTPISVLPDSIGSLTSLKSLDLGRTPIRLLPDSIGNLTSLQSLSLWKSPINVLPDSIGNLTKLQSLNLGGTKIRSLPDSIGNLTNLTSLSLRSCHLQAIPYSVVALELPFVINQRFSNNCVNLTDVTLDEGDLQLFAQPRDVIEAYYRKQTQIRECKVIFLGDGGAGKTALIERITKGTFTPGTPPTDGIETTKKNWYMSVDLTKWKDEQFTVRFLDFGGQEIMHAAHRCFLTGHTVYVVVCESRDDAEIDGVAARWLESVKVFAPNCPVILALNKADLNANVSVNQRDLEKRNKNLKCVLKTSAHDEPDSRYGVNHLIDAIRDEIPGAINDYKVNADMLSVKRALEDMEEDYISSERYREICAEHHITDVALQYSLLGYFRDLGVAYYYESKTFDTRLESVRVLNPEWLTNGIYRLILRTPECGFLSHQTIKDTLRDGYAGDVRSDITYTPEETDYILHVMRYFEISHDMSDGVEMLPLKMPKTPPTTVDNFNKQNALHLRWEGAYLPNNLIHRLLIRKFPELDTKCVWRTGGRFRQIGGGCEALAEMNDKALDAYVNGDRDCRQYLETFRGVIRNILDGLNLKTEEIICHTVNGREGKVSYQAALSHLYNNKPEIYLANIDAYVSPVLLLKEIYVDVNRELARYRQQLAHTFRDTLPLPDKPPEKAENPLDAEKTRAEIEQIHSETEKNKAEVVQIQSEANKNKAETDKIHLVRTAFVGLFLLIAALIVLIVISWQLLPQDLRYEWIGKLVEWLIGFRGE